MSRRNYIHTMDALIGKPYSNAAGELIDATPIVIGEEMPNNEYTSTPTPPIVAVTDGGDLEAIRIEKQRRDAEALRLASLSEAEKSLMQQRIELMKAKREAQKLIVVPVPYVAPPIIFGGGGGGGAMGEETSPKSPTTIAKPSFLKKNFVPLLLVASAIYVFIKNPIK